MGHKSAPQPVSDRMAAHRHDHICIVSMSLCLSRWPPWWPAHSSACTVQCGVARRDMWQQSVTARLAHDACTGYLRQGHSSLCPCRSPTLGLHLVVVSGKPYAHSRAVFPPKNALPGKPMKCTLKHGAGLPLCCSLLPCACPPPPHTHTHTHTHVYTQCDVGQLVSKQSVF